MFACGIPYGCVRMDGRKNLWTVGVRVGSAVGTENAVGVSVGSGVAIGASVAVGILVDVGLGV